MFRLWHYFTVIITLSTIVFAQTTENYIVLSVSESKNTLDLEQIKYQQSIDENPSLANVQDKEKYQSTIVSWEDQFILKIGPFRSGDGLAVTYLGLKTIFPNAFILEEGVIHEASIPKIKYIEKDVPVQEDQTLWTALFGLGIIGILSLFLSSDQLRRLNTKHRNIQKRQAEIEEKQSSLLAKMGEKIQSVALKSVDDEKRLLAAGLKNINEDEIKNHIENLKKHDEELLRTTYELIDFLKIKSGNIIIRQEAFQLSNMLHKLTNAVAPALRTREHTLVYDIQSDVTRYLVGDSARLYQVLHNLLIDVFEAQETNEVVLSIKIRNEENIIFSIINKNQYLTEDEIETLFIPSTWEEIQQTNKDFGFFVIKELISNMHGEFLIDSHKKKGTLYELSLPYTRDVDNKSNKQELMKLLLDRKALVVDTEIKYAKVLMKILEAFNVETTFMSSEHLAKHKPNMEEIDFIVIKSEDVSNKVFNFFKDITKDDTLDIIIINNIFDTDDTVEMVSTIADAELFAPLIIGDVEEVLKQLCIKKSKKKKDVIKEELRQFRIVDIAKVSRTDFQKFTNKNILIVEDNLVSQQVLSSILNASKLQVEKVGNGLEALSFLEKNPQIDLIFMDMDMPVMNGFQTTREIRKLYREKNIPIIAVTGLGFNYEMEQMILAGVDACITKPFKVGQLYIALEKFLEQDGLNEIEVEVKQTPLVQNNSILDIQKGIAYVRSEAFYREIVSQVLLALKNSDILVKEMIQKDNLTELRVFCVDTVGLSATIGATSFVMLLNTMLYDMQENKESYMSEYIILYKDEWLKLEEEMKRYLMR